MWLSVGFQPRDGQLLVLLKYQCIVCYSEFKIPEPPSYNIATALPSYEEAERTKLEQEEQVQRDKTQIIM